MKILLTGSAGFIGFHLTKSLLDDNHKILGIDNINDYYDVKLKKDRLNQLKNYDNFIFKKIDLTEKELLAKEFASFCPQIVVNLAAQAGVAYSMSNPYAYLESNLVGFMNIIECCRNYQVEGLIYASSSSVYGLNTKLPFSINDRVDKPIALYGATKRSNELIAHSYSHLYELNTTGLRYFTVYGPWYRPDMAMFIFINNIINGKKINLYNNGDIYRDFTYIDDIVNGTKQAINKNYNCEIFNLGNNKKEKLSYIIELIENELNLNAIILNKGIKKGDMLETFADITASEHKLNYSPEINIEVGIPKLIKWFKEYYKC
tara:strand:- start:41063 stop:42016 length:954 start_codon:yes stop_codon:yes gene_type:complete